MAVSGSRCIELSNRYTYLVGLLEDDTTLTVTNDNPVDVGVLQLLNTDLTGESTVGLVEDVLGSNADLLVGQAAGEGEVQGGRRDDNLGVRVELSRVKVVHDVGDALDNTVPKDMSVSIGFKLENAFERSVWRGNAINAG